MAADSKRQSFVVSSTDVVGTTFVVTFGFSPTLVLVSWSGRNGTNALGRATYQHGRGFAKSTTARAAVAHRSTDAVGTSDTRAFHNLTSCVIIPHPTLSQSDGLLDVDAVLGTGMRFIVDEQFGSDVRVDVLAIGGDINQSDIGTMQLPDTGGVPPTLTVAGRPFQPECVLFISIGQPTIPGDFGAGTVCLSGMVDGSDQFAESSASANGAATSDTARYTRHGDHAGARIRGNNGVKGRFSFNAFNADGFTVNIIEDNDDIYIFAMLAGGSYAIREFLTATDGTPFVVAVGFRAAGGVVVSCHSTESTDGNVGNAPKKCSASTGFWSSPTERGCHYIYDEDNLGTTRVATGLRDDALYLRSDESASPAVAGLMDLMAVGALDVTMVMDNPDPDAAHCVGIFFGPAADPPVGVGDSSKLAGVPELTKLTDVA